MTTGIVTTICSVYKAGKTVMQAHPGDRLEGVVVDGVFSVSKLTRNGKEYPLDYPVDIMTQYIKLDVAPAPTPPPAPNPTKQYADRELLYVIPNYQLRPLFYPVTKPIPDTRPHDLWNPKQAEVWLTEELQWFWYNDLRSYVPEYTDAQALHDFKYITNKSLAFCNFHGSENSHIFIDNSNPKLGLPVYQNVTCAGALLERVDNKVYSLHGKQQYAFRVINTHRLAGMSSRVEPYRWFRPSITYGAEARVEPFSTFKARAHVPILGNGTDVSFIETRLVRRVHAGDELPVAFTKDWA